MKILNLKAILIALFRHPRVQVLIFVSDYIFFLLFVFSIRQFLLLVSPTFNINSEDGFSKVFSFSLVPAERNGSWDNLLLCKVNFQHSLKFCPRTREFRISSGNDKFSPKPEQKGNVFYFDIQIERDQHNSHQNCKRVFLEPNNCGNPFCCVYDH